MSCIECDEKSKYKCPICRCPYCSVNCYKKHNSKLCEPATEESPTEQVLHNSYDYPTEDTLSLDKLKLLESSKEVKKCLENPHLRSILIELDQAPYPDQLIKHYMQEPIFTELVDECLKIVDPSTD